MFMSVLLLTASPQLVLVIALLPSWRLLHCSYCCCFEKRLEPVLLLSCPVCFVVVVGCCCCCCRYSSAASAALLVSDNYVWWHVWETDSKFAYLCVSVCLGLHVLHLFWAWSRMLSGLFLSGRCIVCVSSVFLHKAPSLQHV